MKAKGKNIGRLKVGCVLACFLSLKLQAQNTLQFTSVNATPEKAIQLYWQGNSNEVYEVDYADSLNGNPDGSTAWNKLYDFLPSQGTNTMYTDCGNFDQTTNILHPANSPMRFYRVLVSDYSTSPTNPTVSIAFPTNGATLSGLVTIQVASSSPEVITGVKLYIDGEEQNLSADGSNFLINTCEYLNGNHTIFATCGSQSGLEGILNTPALTYGWSCSSFVNVNFNNLISEVGFTQPYFEPSLGQKQNVSATFAAYCDWTLQIQDINSNTVLNASGSGTSMNYAWDGTGDGETNIPDGVYNYVISVATNTPPGGFGMSMRSLSMSDDDSTQLYAADTNGNVIPAAILPPGIDTNGYTFFDGTSSDVSYLLGRSSSFSSSFSSDDATPGASPPSPSQSTTAPYRKPTNPVKGHVGSFGICDKTYSTNSFASAHPPTGWPYPLPTLVAVDGQSRTAITVGQPIKVFHTVAQDFANTMKHAGWTQKFWLENNQWGDVDIQKSSLGGHSIFNTCNFGLLMCHGSYGVSGSTGTEDDNIHYTYFVLGSADRVRLSDVDFGSTGTDGLMWMTMLCCNMLNPTDYNSMNNAGKIPVNENLHELIGHSTYTYAFHEIGLNYAYYLTDQTEEIYQAYIDTQKELYNINQRYIQSGTYSVAVSYWSNCFHDKLLSYQSPDPSDGLQYTSTQVWPQ